jgi:hypothetical protein
LRVGDLRCLELGWFDRRAKTLALTQHKTGPPLRLPLPGDVGWAVIDYIRNGRPEAGCSSSTATRSRRLARRRRRAAGAHPTFGVGKDADPLFIGSPHTRLTRWGINKILARHVQSLRRRDPGSAAGVAAV